MHPRKFGSWESEVKRRYYLVVKMNTETKEQLFCDNEIYITKSLAEEAAKKKNRDNRNNKYEYGWTCIFHEEQL
jgi:hypothetical protein